MLWRYVAKAILALYQIPLEAVVLVMVDFNVTEKVKYVYLTITRAAASFVLDRIA